MGTLIFVVLIVAVPTWAIIPPQFHALHTSQNNGMGGENPDLWVLDPAKKATTAIPIICLMEWNSPKCREHAFNVPAPKFAPNFKFPKPPVLSTDETNDGDTGQNFRNKLI
jgi:hypothetical protein